MAAGTTPEEVARWFEEFIDETMEETAAIVSKIGEDALAIARQEHVYKTRTGNLQSSCGFAVTFDGKTVLASPFTPKPGQTDPDGQTGSQAGKQFLEERMANALPKGISLIMVAGMDYAGYVERWGGDVLKSAEAHVRREFDKLARGTI